MTTPTITIPLAYYRALEDVHESMSVLIDEGLRHWNDDEKKQVLAAFAVMAKLQPEGDRYDE